MVIKMIKHADIDSFNDIINDDLVLVDFFATWCGPCKTLGPVLEDISSDRSNLVIAKVDIDECSSLAKEYGVMAVPTLILFKNGKEIAKQTGFMPKDMLTSWIEDNR